MVSKQARGGIKPVNSNRTEKMAKYSKTNSDMILPETTIGGGNCQICDSIRAQAWKLPSGERVILCKKCRNSIEFNLNG